MSVVAASHGPPVRIYRPERGVPRRVRFQEEWALADDPEQDHKLSQPMAFGASRPGRYFEAVRSVALSASVSAFVTLVLTVRAVGVAPGFAETWLTTLKLSLLIGLPARFLFEPYVARLVGLVVAPPRAE